MKSIKKSIAVTNKDNNPDSDLKYGSREGRSEVFLPGGSTTLYLQTSF